MKYRSLADRFVRNVLLELERQDLNKHRLSKLLGVTPNRVQQMLDGTRADPQLSTIEKVAHALNVDPLKLLRDTRQPQETTQ